MDYPVHPLRFHRYRKRVAESFDERTIVGLWEKVYKGEVMVVDVK